MRKMLLAAALILAGCDSQPPKSIDEINQIVRLADGAVHVAETIGQAASTEDVHAALANMNVANDAAGKQINEIAGRVQPHDVNACFRTSVTIAAAVERMPIDMFQPERALLNNNHA